MIRVLSGNELGLPTPKSFASKVASGNPLVRSGKPPPSNYPFGPGALRCEHRRLSRRLAHGQSEPKRRCWSSFRLVAYVYPPPGRKQGVSGIEQYRRRSRSGKSTLPGGTCRKSISWFLSHTFASFRILVWLSRAALVGLRLNGWWVRCRSLADGFAAGPAAGGSSE